MLHHSLRDLVQAHGVSLLGDGEQLRAALDDFLDDSEATEAELNMLALAASGGAVERIGGLVRAGADPQDAIAAAATAIADRSGIDRAGARWAVSALAFAMGHGSDASVDAARAAYRASLSTSGGPGEEGETDAVVPPPPPPAPPAPPTVPVSAPAPVPPAPRPVPGADVPTVGASPGDAPTKRDEPEPADPPGETTAPRRSSRRWATAAVVLLLASAAGLAWWMTRPDDAEGPSTADKTMSSEKTSSSPGDETGPTRDDEQEDPQSDAPVLTGYLAYATRVSGTSKVVVRDLATGEQRTVAVDGSATQPSVSADGRTVAFVVDTADGPRLGIAQGSAKPRLLDVGRDPASPAVSPDGSTVAYVVAGVGGRDVMIQRLADATAGTVAAGSADEFDPAWSADGSVLSYVLTGSAHDQIVMVDPVAGTEVGRVEAIASAESPAPSPDGSQVAYVSVDGTDAEVVLATVGSTSVPADISQSAERETGVVWLDASTLITSAPDRGLVAITTSSPAAEPVTDGVGDAL